MKETRSALREKILEAAVALFIEKGLENVKTRELTTFLGLSRSHIYHYFPDWANLCLEACYYFASKDLAAFKAEICHLAPRERLNAFVSNYLTVEPDATWQLYSSIWSKATVEQAYGELAELVGQQWFEWSVSIISEGIRCGDFRQTDSEQVARQLGAMLNGYADNLIVSQSQEERSQSIVDIQAFLKLVL
ncbi:TetR/AcrR family transcriptional regulator [uncultured Cedecea sp.]|uniref:TetR/AcrR family transcriptional regulator n=1 Tax=uncultured Cedecea sp. TaxID=988762 RepID=UPI00260FDA33|nr:TetR/AcrR family transcriptional regulator [uncultured Cedecea sp.]